MTKKFIGITGKKRAGKDSAAGFMEGYTKLSFADPMRRMMNLFCIVPKDFDYDLNKEDEILTLVHAGVLRKRVEKEIKSFFGVDSIKLMNGLSDFLNKYFSTEVKFSARKFLQLLGTEWGRETINPDIWARRSILIAKYTKGNIVFSDVRFDNEAQLIKDLDGTIIKVVRSGAEEPAEDHHESENGLHEDLIDAVVTAENLDELQVYIEEIIKS